MKRSPLPPRRRPIRKTRVKKVNHARKAKALLRAYGPPERREFVRALSCRVVLCVLGPIEQVHAAGGGVGRKADASLILPLCRDHHRLLHTMGVKSFERVFNINLREQASITERLWASHVAQDLRR